MGLTLFHSWVNLSSQKVTRNGKLKIKTNLSWVNEGESLSTKELYKANKVSQMDLKFRK